MKLEIKTSGFPKKKIKRQSKAFLDHLKHQTLKNRINILKYNLWHNALYSPFPLYAKIEINGTCNLSCTMCLRTSLPNRDIIMSFEWFKIVLDACPELIEWSPHGYNEPFLNKDIYKMLEEGNNRSISSYIVTNGTLLNEKNADRLIKTEPRQVRFSVDAVGQAYEKIRVGADYQKVKKNIKYFAENYSNTGLYAVIWGENINQIPKLINFAEELNVVIGFVDLTWYNNYLESTKENSIRENKTRIQIDNMVDEFKNRPLANFEGFYKQEERVCTLPWSSTYIDVVGDIYPCTDTFKYKIGNIFENPMKEIYNNNKMIDFRKNSLTGKHPECRNCLAFGKTKGIELFEPHFKDKVIEVDT